jgi:hypothetical protein
MADSPEGTDERLLIQEDLAKNTKSEKDRLRKQLIRRQRRFAKLKRLDRPLPELQESLAFQVILARAKAGRRLYRQLDLCWAACFPTDKAVEEMGVPDPGSFFQPILEYGTAIFRAYAKVLLKISPSPSFEVYRVWLRLTLPQQICDELAPRRQTAEPWEKGVRHPPPLSGWQSLLRFSWERRFGHPKHEALDSKVRSLFDALEDPTGWGKFVDALYQALESETRTLLVKAMNSLGANSANVRPPNIAQSPELQSQDEDQSSVERAKEARAKTVGLIVKELNALKPRMFEDESEYAKLRSENPNSLTFRIAADRPDLRKKVLAIQASTRHVRLAQELAAAHHGRSFSTIQDDWKHHKPNDFRRRK